VIDLTNGSNLQQFLFLAALSAMIFILLRRSHRKLINRKQDDSPMVRVPRPRKTTARQGTIDAPPEVLRWEVEMHETARDLSAQLDSKMSALQALIADADRAAARLEAAQGLSANPPLCDPPPLGAGPPPVTEAAESPETSNRREEIYTLADYGLDTVGIANRTGLPIGEVELTLSLRDKR